MSIKNKWYFSEQVLLELQPDLRGRDEKVDQREILLRMDAIVNMLAKEGFLENWKYGFFGNVEEQFLTRFEWLTVTDGALDAPSVIELPAGYVSLPKQIGIEQVYFKNDFAATTKKYFDPVIITSFKDRMTYRSNMAGNLEGRISCFPQGNSLVFDRANINADYGQIGIALMIRDSSAIGDTALYPIPANMEQVVIDQTVAWFRARLGQPQAAIKDSNEKT